MPQHTIEPKQIYIDSFNIKGITVRTKNSDESNPDSAKLGKHWYKYFSEKWDEKILERTNNEALVYGVYANYASDVNDYYNLTAGVLVPEFSPLSPQEAEQKIELITIQPGNYLVFENRGQLPQSIIECWQAIWAYFEKNPQIQRKYSTDFEAYFKDDQVAVYIGLK